MELLYFIWIGKCILELASRALFISPQGSCQKVSELTSPVLPPHYSFLQNGPPPTLL